MSLLFKPAKIGTLETPNRLMRSATAERMANDVDQALHQIIAEHGGKTEEKAAAYVEQMKGDKRYRRDVY